MKNFFYLPAFIAVTLFCACEKHQTDAERQAEVERQVQERLAAERQTQEQQRLTQAQVDLDQRLKDVESRNAAAAATAAPAQRTRTEPEPERDRRPSVTHRTRDDSSNGATASYSTFYTKLEPQGEWRETSNYGYVWQPRVAQQSQAWRPYTNGRWVYTDAGCTWISEEPFGWATYHYGRWTRLRNIGWVWVPGEEWAPAWVSWRKSNDYVGWAPLPPEARFEHSSGIHNWADNYYDIGPDQYAFVPTNQFGDQRVDRAVVSMDRNVAIINQTTNITNITYSNTTVVNQGPNYEEMRSRSQQPMERFRLERQVTVNFDAGDPRSVVRGQVVEIPAPIIARAQPVERPRNVRETIAQVVVDHGWERMGDRQAAEKVRIKMKGEATPPPNAPSRVFVKPAEAAPAAANAATATVPATTPSATAAATATVAPTVSAAPSASPRREMPPRVQPDASPSATATISPAPSAPARAVSTPILTPAVRPSATVSSTPEATASAVSSPTPRINQTVPPATSSPRSLASPTASVAAETSSAPPSTRFGRSGDAKEQRKSERQMRRQEGSTSQPGETLPQSNGSSPASTATPASSTSPASDAPSLSRRELRRQERAGGRPTPSTGASTRPTEGTSSATATPVGTATPASSATPETPGPASASRRELRKEERKAKRAGERAGAAESGESPSPSPQ